MRTMALAMRHALTPAVVLFWLVMVGLPVHKQAPPPSAPQALLAAGTTPERDEWFGVERDGKRVGRAHRARAHRHRPPLHGGSSRLADHARRAPDGPHLARCRDR